jgi:hypothetical protein
MLEITIPSTKVSISEGEVNFLSLEQTFLEVGKKLGREALGSVLKQMDKTLEESRDKERYVLKDVRSRKILTTLGELNLHRRYYRDQKEKRHVALLDEALGIEKDSRLSGRLKDLSCQFATEMSFGKVSQLLESTLGEAVSRHGIWKTVQEKGAEVEEKQSWERDQVFKQGKELPQPAKAPVCLFGEADGCMVSLQRSLEKKAELKVGVWYEGWNKKPVAREEYELVNKRYVGTSQEAEVFWEQMTVEAQKRYGLYGSGKVPLVYAGGDGASWILEGAKWLGADRIKLDVFHVHRLLGRTFGFSDPVQTIVSQLLDGASEEAVKGLTAIALEESDDKKREKMAKAMAWVNEHGKYVEKITYPDQLKGNLLKRQLGTMERHVDLTVAERFKKRGMSWKKKSAGHLLALRICKLNGEWPPGFWKPPAVAKPARPVKRTRKKKLSSLRVHEAGMPIFRSGRSWPRRLKRQVLGRVLQGVSQN